jgi:thiamine pyrophosphate-dependent acetolactate synthase large subunit-like protein
LDASAYKPRVFQRQSTTVPNSADIKCAAEVLNQARKVVVFAGIGARSARDELIAVAETLGAPIVRSLRGKTVLPDEHPLALGGIGLLGGKPGVQALEKCDAFLLVGTDFPYRDFYPRGIPAVQIDVDPTHLGKRCPVTVGLAGDAAPTLQALAGELRRKTERGFLEACQLTMRNWLADMRKTECSNDKPIRPQRVARAIGDLARDDAIFLCDTGTVTVWVARNLHLRGDQQFTLSASLASMAFALPAAIGAQLAYPDRQVIALAGDGGFGMLMADFLTAVKYKLPITVVVFNNGKLGLIQVEQETEGLPNFQTSLHNPDFAEYARLCGGEGFHVSDPEELEPALKQAFASNQACVVDVIINPDELPMPPKIMWDRMFGYGVAKVKELLGA